MDAEEGEGLLEPRLQGRERIGSTSGRGEPDAELGQRAQLGRARLGVAAVALEQRADATVDTIPVDPVYTDTLAGRL